MKEIISGVYKITNKVNGHFYIGSSVNIYRRWLIHKWNLNNHKSHNVAFQRAWEKYGEESFDFSILLICDKENTTMYEQIYLDYYKPEYNIAIDALYPNRGRPLSEEHKRKIGEANSKHKMSDEQKEFLRQLRTGIPLSEEQKKKMSESQKKAHSMREYGFIKGQTAWNKGKHCSPHSEETRKKQSEAMKGEKNPMFGKTNKDNPNYGRHRSPETKQKISKGLKEYRRKRKEL